jgi:hypothetical protein
MAEALEPTADIVTFIGRRQLDAKTLGTQKNFGHERGPE